ncbi:MAG: iron-sulfur cluster assembly protein [Opitutales bacterium]
MLHEDFTLTRDCPGTRIPSGEELTLPAGTTVTVSQALGGTVTVRYANGLFRIASEHVAALGERATTQPEDSDVGPQVNPDEPFSEDQVWTALKSCFDPEIPINIVDLGLIYDLRTDPAADDRHRVAIQMTLTAQGCGMGPVIADDARRKVEALPGVESATVDIVWDPPWNPQMISEAGRKRLDID